MVSVNVNVLPATLPGTVPRPVTGTPDLVPFAVIVPLTDVPDCVSVSVIVPVPEASSAEPLQVPATFAGVLSGAVGVEAVVPLVQPARANVTAKHAQRNGRRK